MSMTLVLAGGGPAALAWELGVLSNSHVEVVYADQDSMTAPGNPLALDIRAAAARAGRTVGRTAATRVARLFGQPAAGTRRLASTLSVPC